MSDLGQDFRNAARGLARNPKWAVIALTTLALGIGGTSAIFAFVDGFVLNPFAYPQASRLVAVGAAFPRQSAPERFIEVLSPPEFADIGRATTLRQVTAFDAGNRTISGGDRPERVFTALFMTDPFATFGLRPLHGRGFAADELAPNGPRAAILSHRLWQSRFGGDLALVGRTIRINGEPATVVGIMPPELLVLGADLWIPRGTIAVAEPRGMRLLTVLARLAPGVSLDSANAELAAIAGRTNGTYGADFREYGDWRLVAKAWPDVVMGEFRTAGFLLLGAVGLVLLIACANLANLLLARSASQQREIAVRLTLGANPLAIARHVLAETLLLSAVGGMLGLLIALLALRAAVVLIPARMGVLGVTASLNTNVVAWTAVVSVGCAVLVALMPLLHAVRITPGGTLGGDGRSHTSGRAPQRMRSVLVVAEIALSLTLLAGASLLGLSFYKLSRVEPGIDPQNVLTMRLTLARETYQGEAINGFFQQAIERLAAIPGVVSTSAASQLPLSAFAGTRVRVMGDDVPGTTIPTAWITVASDAHFSTFRIPLVAGRTFTTRDGANSPRVTVVNQAFVARFLRGRDPLRSRLDIGPPNQPRIVDVVGVVANARNQGIAQPSEPELFVPMHQQTAWNQLFVAVRSQGDPVALLPAVRRTIADIDPEQPIYAIATLEDALAESSFQSRTSSILLGLFAVVAVGLAAIGVYGVMSLAVAVRRREIGIRMALGAKRAQVIRLVLGQSVRLTIAGTVIGLALALSAAPLLRRVLFEVQPTDPIALAGVALAVSAVALMAAWWPARRASLIQPASAIRDI
jgi:putative ABC transport system permease protein